MTFCGIDGENQTNGQEAYSGLEWVPVCDPCARDIRISGGETRVKCQDCGLTSHSALVACPIHRQLECTPCVYAHEHPTPSVCIPR